MTTLTRPMMGIRQHGALIALKAARAGLTAPELRNELDFSPDAYGTRQAHALLRRLEDLGHVEREEMTEKVAAKHRIGVTGRTPSIRFKITTEGKAALRAQG